MNYAVAFPAGAVGLVLGAADFVVFKKTSDGTAPTNAAPLALTEMGLGTYTFAYVAAEDVVFVLDGGVAIDGEARYVRGVLSPQDDRLDAAVSTRATQASVDALEDLSTVDVTAVLDAQGLTTIRAAHLDADISTRATVSGILSSPWTGHVSPTTVGGLLVLAAAAAGGPHSRLDALAYDDDGNLSLARLRIFADAAAAAASTPGATGEGELLSVDIVGTQVNAAQFRDILRTTS